MTSAIFSAALVSRAATAKLKKLQDIGHNSDDQDVERLGEIIDMTVDLEAQQGPTAQIDLALEDHKLLHGYFPKTGA